MAGTRVSLNEFHTQCALKAESRGPGTYEVKTSLRSYAMLSTLFVSAVDAGATIKVNYYEQTTGSALGERFDLRGHDLVDDTATFPYSDKICIPKLHSSLIMEVIITGGNVTFGVLQSSTDASLLDAVLDETGAIPVDTSPGTPFHTEDAATSVESADVEILSFTVPAGTTRELTQVVGTACEEGIFRLENDGTGDIYALFGTTPANVTKEFKFDPARPIPPGATLKLYFTANEDNGGSTVHGFVMANDKT